jgi:peroxiredoxin Q/BCP
MPKLKIGDPAPYFNLPDQERNFWTLEDFIGKWLVLFFYPQDESSGGSTECTGFSNAIDEFMDLDAQIVGISGDSVESHQKFTEEFDLKVRLLTDEIHSVIKEYGAHTFEGTHTNRDTILIDPLGNIAFIWRGVNNPEEHPAEVKAKIAELKE